MSERQKPKTYRERIPGSKGRDRLLRHVSSKHAARYGFGLLPEAERLVLAHTIMTKDRRLAFVKNSKAGCTTVANLIYQREFGHPCVGDIHHAPLGMRPGYSNWLELRDCLHNSTSFATVRDPITRSVSAFYDFFIVGKNPEASKHLGLIEAFGLSARQDLPAKFDCFLEYVTSCLGRAPMTTDRHFRPQHINLGHGLIELSFIARVESLQDDLNRLSTLSGVDLPPLQSVPREKANQSGSSAFSPSPEQIRQIERLYREDFDIYGY